MAKAKVAPPTYKDQIIATEGIAQGAREWMLERGPERTFAWNVIRKFGGFAIIEDAAITGVEFEDGSELNWQIVEGYRDAPD